ncbi:MAG: C4-type zinc ribbon domain-containing protein [Limisphaerales bacterium]
MLKNLIHQQELTQRFENKNRTSNLRKEIGRLRTGLPDHILRRFNHLAEHRRIAVAQLSESGACSGCHMKLPSADALRIRSSSHQLATCPFCGCFLYSPTATLSNEQKELNEIKA